MPTEPRSLPHPSISTALGSPFHHCRHSAHSIHNIDNAYNMHSNRMVITVLWLRRGCEMSAKGFVSSGNMRDLALRIGRSEPVPDACAECQAAWERRRGITQKTTDLEFDYILMDCDREDDWPKFSPNCPSCVAEFEGRVAGDWRILERYSSRA